MDYTVLPDLLTLAVLIGSFRPLVRKAGAHVNTWFVAWAFILLHYIALLFCTSPAPGPRFAWNLTALWSVELGGLWFMRSASKALVSRVGQIVTLELAVPLLLQAFLAELGGVHPRLQATAAALFLLPGLHMLLRKRHRAPFLVQLAIASALLGGFLSGLSANLFSLSTSGILCLLYLGAAYLYASNAPRFTRSVFCAVLGLVGWALSYPFLVGFHYFHPLGHVARSLLDLPRFLVAAGMLVTLLDEQMTHTERMAMHDALTNLPNRRMFEDHFVAAMAESRARHTPVACLVIDVDNFKQINDTLGHDTGDELLKALAIRLSWHMGPHDILARTGGDEFSALLAGVNDEYHLRFIASAMMAAASVPLSIDGRSVDFHISIGIAVSPEDANDIQGLRKAADDAMYHAKRAGGSLLAFASEL